ncbi:Vacuolar protein sorting-associated protein 4B [Apiospora marii]|uniref:Vacuolar protein sorting-associated protein 4B n=1 Tax=Apiospora marii TaxID=335849 RepID=UPI00312F779E
MHFTTTLLTLGPLLAAGASASTLPLTSRDTYDRKGSGMCGAMQVKYCDEAVNNFLIKDDAYRYRPSVYNQCAGACSGAGAQGTTVAAGCHVSVEGDAECRRSGNQLWGDYQDLHPNSPSDLPFVAKHHSPGGLDGEGVFVQTFYEGPPTCICCKNWVEDEPDEVPPEIKQKYIGAAIILYRCKSRTSTTVRGLNDYTIESVDIQSPLIRKLIRPLLTDLGATYPTDAMVVGAPFKSLFFGYSRIRDIFGQLEDGGEEKQHMKLLVDCMDGLFREMGPKMKDLQSKGMIDAANIWALFPKGAIVYSRHGGHDRALEVVKLQDWRLECRSLAFDGSIFGWESVEITLKEFTGTRNINELEAYPLRFHPEQKALEESLAKRGAKALEYQDISLLDYDGQAHGRRQVLRYYLEDEYDVVDEWLYIKSNGRVVVDVYQGKNHISVARNVTRLTPDIPDRSGWPFPQGRRPTLQEQGVFREVIGANRTCLMLMSPTTVAYHLKEKIWAVSPAIVSIDGLSPTSWNDAAFDQLVLPESTKDIVRTFVETHKTTQALGCDFVAGKGKGLVILLSGPTGTGKTLTVESVVLSNTQVSDKVKKPLYHLQAGKLGSKPSTVSSSLQKAYRMCEEWDGVLLLDEADALIRDRDRDTHASEDLCCAFPVLLATLEYYSGIIFMTTNLLEGVDPAIISRLDIHLEYPCLDFATRLQLWRNLLPMPTQQPPLFEDINDDMTVTPASIPSPTPNSTLDDIRLAEADFRDLASWRVNGRDIKHAVKNATKWCFIKKEPITLEALQTGLMVTAPRSQREENMEMDSITHGKRRRVDEP